VKPRKKFTAQVRTNRVGAVRPSQLMYAYGVGSIVDLPNFSVVVTGLDDWARGQNRAHQDTLAEPRLLAAVRYELGAQVSELRTAPWLVEDRDPVGEWTRTGVPVVPFPRWMRCTACNRLGSIDGGEFTLENKQVFRIDRARYLHTNCQYGSKPAVPARLIVACARGHLDEFPWLQFTHRGAPCAAPRLRMTDIGAGSRSTDVTVACLECGASNTLSHAFGENAPALLPRCRGRQAHLRRFDDGGCELQARPLLLGASNSWFPVTRSVVSIPSSMDELEDALARLWPALQAVPDGELAMAIKYKEELAELRRFADAVLPAVQARRAKGQPDAPAEKPNLLLPEWEVFTNPDKAPANRDFRLRAVAPPAGHEERIAGTVLVERLREVVALVGFTRIDAPDSGVAEDVASLGTVAPLTRPPNRPEWVPSAEVRGEGLFIQLTEAAVKAWCERVADTPRIEALRMAHRRWRGRRRLEPTEWPGERYLLLHSLSHALINEAALECGYATASIRERIYASRGGDGVPAMAGILLYTAAQDSEGTLGGLVSLGEPGTLGRLLGRALERARLCSTDLMCADHTPGESEDVLHNASCHACLFVPETSCERGNRFLDRAALIHTMADASIEFFAL
jgi:hypothetical protein